MLLLESNELKTTKTIEIVFVVFWWCLMHRLHKILYTINAKPVSCQISYIIVHDNEKQTVVFSAFLWYTFYV